MRSQMIVGGVIAVAALFLVGSSHGQVQPLPGPGSGVVTVHGTVDIGNVPVVSAAQHGAWSVSLVNPADVRVTNTPTVVAAPPSFMKAGARYDVIWSSSEHEVIRVADVSGTWVRVDASGRRRWLNLATAHGVDEVP